jgi:hypothetical protein
MGNRNSERRCNRTPVPASESPPSAVLAPTSHGRCIGNPRASHSAVRGPFPRVAEPRRMTRGADPRAARSVASGHQESGPVLSSAQCDTDRLFDTAFDNPAAADQTSQPSHFFVQGRQRSEIPSYRRHPGFLPGCADKSASSTFFGSTTRQMLSTKAPSGMQTERSLRANSLKRHRKIAGNEIRLVRRRRFLLLISLSAHRYVCRKS